MEPHEDIVGKSPTTLLIKGSTGSNRTFQSSGVQAYGRLAQRLYANNQIPHGAQLFKRFKMHLHSNPSKRSYDDLLNSLTTSSSTRAEMRLMDIFVIALDYIKSVALARMTVTKRVQPHDVMWVLTVPVCCSEAAKHFMREAAKKAGFIQGGHDDDALVLCMEPIAACLALGNRLTWRMHDKYLVIDCGGGTVDISAFKVVNPASSSLEQLGKATGGPWGSTYVDKQFEAYLKDFIYSVAHGASKPGLDSFFSSSSMYRILQSWERAKVGLQRVDGECRIDLSELSQMPLEVGMNDMDHGRTLKNRGGEELVGGHGTWDLVLRSTLLREFFKPQCDKIAQAVSEQLDTPELQGITSIVMVGGFSGSVHVQAAIKECVLQKYPDNSVSLAVPQSPDLAIVQGAAHCVPLQQRHPSGGNVQHYPVAPQFQSIVSAISYGILVAEDNGNTSPSIFDPFFVKGRSYAMNAMVRRRPYRVLSDEPFILSIGSSGSPHVHPGRNHLNNIGGFGAVHRKEFSVATPTPPVEVYCLCLKRKVKEVSILVEFTLSGIDLHVRVRSWDGQVLLQQTVPFLSC
ncbi:unnamed protein product [Pylaiella littoralis]